MKNSNTNRATNPLGFERIERQCLTTFDRVFPRQIRIFNEEKILVVRIGDEKAIGNKTLGRLDFMKKYMGWQVWRSFNEDDFKKNCVLAYGQQEDLVRHMNKGRQNTKGQSRR